MAKKQLKIKILPNGEVQMETQGIKGKKCLDYIEMMKMLGDFKIEKQEYTSEYYEENSEYYSQDEEINIYDNNN